MKRLYKYTGTISYLSYHRNGPNDLALVTIDLHDANDDDKSPIRIEARGGLADYIDHVGLVDAEERNLTANWYYDEMLCLRRIEIPSMNPDIPAKIIAQHDLVDAASIFGPIKYIETRHPKPMNREQCSAWLAFLTADEHRYIPPKGCQKEEFM